MSYFTEREYNKLVDGTMLLVRVAYNELVVEEIDGIKYFVMSNRGEDIHRLSVEHTDCVRLSAHWNGYCASHVTN